MNSEGLDPQARMRIEKSLRLMVSYLNKLTGRMHQTMFPADDPLKGERQTPARRSKYCTTWRSDWRSEFELLS